MWVFWSSSLPDGVCQQTSQVQLIHAMATEWCVGGGEGKLPSKSWVVVDRHHAYMRTKGTSEELVLATMADMGDMGEVAKSKRSGFISTLRVILTIHST